MKPQSQPVVTCKQPGRYIGWPTVARTNDGETALDWAEDQGHANVMEILKAAGGERGP